MKNSATINTTKLKVGDNVIVIAGKSKGQQGEIIGFANNKERVLVKGVNLGKKHIKGNLGQAGSTVQVERSMHISNVMLIDPKDKKATKLGYTLSKDGKKVRIAKKSGQELK